MNAIISSQAPINQDYTLWLIVDPKITWNLPLNFCARVCSVDDILLIASRVFLSIAWREWRANFCSITGLQHDPAVDTSQYRSLTSEKGKRNKESIKVHSWKTSINYSDRCISHVGVNFQSMQSRGIFLVWCSLLASSWITQRVGEQEEKTVDWTCHQSRTQQRRQWSEEIRWMEKHVWNVYWN